MSREAPARLLIATAVGCLVLALALRAGHFDRPLFLAVNEAAWRWLPAALVSCTTILGHGLVATVLMAPALLRAPNLLAAGLFATPVAMVLSWLPKGLIDSPRPAALLDPACLHIVGIRLAGHNSLPSGHTLTAFLVVGVLQAARPRWPAALAIAGVGIAVALSRVAVGAHWPSDVLAGAGLGLLAGQAGTRLSERWPLAARPGGRAVLTLIVLACAAALAWTDTGYPLARPMQAVLSALGACVAVWTLWRIWADWRATARQPG
ncbi:MAG TPA: phosphatase PAP2 family protein [Burkholderiaceae bacterium]|jgi:undecaprenyl-diphosphatase|nr:phosphatase PAP2 family protein [Burkholderiaceae bacterium]